MAARTSSSNTNTVTNIRKSRYVQGGLTDKYPNRVGWWERRELEKNDLDLRITIRPNEDRRPDLVAHRVYQDTSLQWLVLQYNAIVDIETEFTAGTELRLPSPRRVSLDIMTQQTGGNRIR